MMKRSVTIGGVIWPDAETQGSVNEIRKRYDPHFKLIAPHITVIFPTQTEISLEDLRIRLTNALEGCRPFGVTLNRVSSVNLLAPDWPVETSALLAYANAKNAIFLLAGKGSKEILDLKNRLSAALGLDTPLGQYPPYLTLGQTLSDEAYQAALESLAEYAPSYSFPVNGFDLLIEAAPEGWQTAHRFEFSS
jgi:2'-5' RNA ligase